MALVKGSDLSWFDTNSRQALKRRALAAKLYYSGRIGGLCSRSIDNGLPPYRVIRYRRVVDPDKLPFPLLPDGYVSPKSFTSNLKYLARNCHLMPLEELIARIENDAEIPPLTVAVTLDGGHMDNYLYALPRLLEYSVPATFFVPSGYIGRGLYLFDDRITMLLMILQHHEKKMPRWDFLPQELREIIGVEADLEINGQTITNFLSALRFASHIQRAQVIATLVEQTWDLCSLPEFEDFMRWDDLRHLQALGFTIGGLGSWAISNPNLSPAEFETDFTLSLSEFSQQQIDLCPIHALANPQQLEASLPCLKQREIRWSLLESSFPEARYQISSPMMLGRVSMFESCSFCPELFACRLWNLL